MSTKFLFNESSCLVKISETGKQSVFKSHESYKLQITAEDRSTLCFLPKMFNCSRESFPVQQSKQNDSHCLTQLQDYLKTKHSAQEAVVKVNSSHID